MVCVSLNSALWRFGLVSQHAQNRGSTKTCQEEEFCWGEGGGGRGEEKKSVSALANSASTRSRIKPYSMSSSARNTSAGMMVFLLCSAVTSLALY